MKTSLQKGLSVPEVQSYYNWPMDFELRGHGYLK